MPSSARPKTDVLKTLWLIFLLPVFLLFIGIALMVAAMRGRLGLPGGINLEPGKYRRFGRVSAFILGLMMWAAVWGALGWVWLQSGRISETSKIMSIPPVPTHTATALPPTATAHVTAGLSTPTQPVRLTVPASTPVRPPPPTSTAIPPAPSPSVPTSIPVPPAAATNPAQALQAVQSANILLRQAIVTPDDDHLAALSMAWSGEALADVQQFAVQMNRKYHSPIQVTYQLLDDLTMTPALNDETTATVSSTEIWQFSNAFGRRTAMTAYRYTLRSENAHWKIVSFTFTVLATPTPAALVP